MFVAAGDHLLGGLAVLLWLGTLSASLLLFLSSHLLVGSPSVTCMKWRAFLQFCLGCLASVVYDLEKTKQVAREK